MHSILCCNIFPKLGEKSKPNSLSNYEILQFRLWAPLKLVLTLIKALLLGHLPTWLVYKVLYVHSFYSLYYYHHYDLCLVKYCNIILYGDLELAYH